MQKVQAEMGTEVALNTLKAETSLKSLNAVISSTKNAWKSQEAALKSTGEYLKAAETRYKGLGDSIKAQESKIESLRDKQKGLDVTTKDGAESYLKYQKDIDSATTQLKSLEAQQTRAKSSLEYQKSGLAGLQTEYKQITTVSNSYVERLKAEGKQQEANKAQMTGYKDIISNLNKQLSAQEKELSRIATASGKDSDAWRTQKVRVDETATALAKTKTSMTELDSAMKKANPSVFSRIKTAIEGTNKQAEKTPSLFKKIVAGGLVTNAISNGFSTLTSSIKSTITSGLELDEAGEKINDTWKNMGKNANDIQILGDQMGYLRAQTGASGTEINTMQKSVDSFTHGVTEKTTVISAGIAGIATASHIGGSGMDTLAKSMQKVVASGDLTSGGLARLEKQAPTLGAQLAKAAGVSQGAFATMVAKGKISSADFQNLLYKIGTTSGTTFKTYGKTAEGAMAQIRGGWTSLKAKLAAPLLEVKNSGMASLSSLITSPVVQNAATSLGNGLAYVANMAKKGLDYISAHKKDVTGIASDMWDIAKVAGAEVWSIAKTTIKDIAGWLGVGGKNAKTMKDPLGTVHDILDKIAKNKDGIKGTVKVLAALWVTKKVLTFAGSLLRVYDNLKKLSETELFSKIAANFSKFANSKLGTATAVVTIAYDAVSDIKDLTKAFSKGGTVGQKFHASGETAGTLIGGGIGFVLGGPVGAAIGATVGKVAGGWAGDAAKKFTDGWNAKAKPKDWLGKLGFNAHKGATGIAKWWKGIQTQNDKSNAQMEKQQAAANKKMKKDWDSFWGKVGDKTRSTWSDVKKSVSDGLSKIKSNSKSGMAGVKSHISDAWTAVKSKTSSTWSSIKSKVGGVVDWVSSHVKGGWSGLGGVVGRIFGSVGNAIVHPIQTAKSLLGGLVNGIKGLFNFHIRLPHIPLPHFDISGSMNPLDWIKHHTLPHISVDWYANGGLINTPTLLSAGNRMAIGGEAGPEMVVPLSASKASRAWQLLGQAVQQINASQSSAQTQVAPASDNSDLIAAINALGLLMTKLSFNVQIGDDQFYPKVAPKVKAYNDRQNSFRTA
ncbi:tape measure protein [Lacticaseibacillus mingshuiensis]|uniref:Tape measure protein n=1 Tax=Lacticaseibacillus mingshuiensis TaxID=2799574 RepID=A0ABW4CI67_9LACO|nr:tape measure protein [Lacticaseibacillus mingshuiensis]